MTDAGLGVPLALATRRLQAALAERSRALGASHVPSVVPLGAADATGAADEYAALRPAATVHLATDSVLVAPWGPTYDTTRPCGTCLAIRWQRLRAAAERDALETGNPARATGAWPLLTQFVADATWALLESSRQEAPPGVARVSRLDLSTLLVETVDLLAEPLCPAHSPAKSSAAQSTAQSPTHTPKPGPLRLAGRPKPSAHGYRLRNADSYGLPTGALANPVCGVLGPGTIEDLTAPTTAAVSGRFFERGRDGLNDIGWSGKADSFAASRDLAFLEGLERYAGTRPRGGQPQLMDSLANLGDSALDPRDCGEYPAETYRRDPTLRRFSPTDRIPWVWGHSLRDDRPILVPARTSYYGIGTPVDDFVFECSNGCAIGSCLEEAVLFGLLELIERDAFLLGWYAGAPMTEIDLASVPGGPVRTLLDRAELHGYDVRVFDNRVDLSVPVVTSLAVRRDGGLGTLSFAAGAALDPAQAVAAALGEALTYLPHLRQEAAGRRAELEAMAADFDRVAELRDHALLFALPESAAFAGRYLEPARRLGFDDVYSDRHQSPDLLHDLERCRRELVAAGCDVIVVDQTTPEQARLGLCTVRMLAPGLLPIDFGWGRQRALAMPRLRTAYRRAGRLDSDLTHADLHRVPHPFP